MSKAIDQRVVEMKFDNKQFEENVATSMSTLGKLKQSLNLSGASKGLENVGSAAKKCDMSGLGDAVESVRMKFSALQVMAIAALTNITNKVVDAGLQIAKSFALDPIMDGFREYELKMGSIQTIMANTSRHGTTLEDVSASLDELNEYADKTIYNFGGMTEMIGKVTIAGTNLEDATAFVKGFANEAATAGTTAMEMNGALYQTTQALNAGVVKLMDWKSLTNRGMGGKNMQEGLIEMAIAMGVIKEKSRDAKNATKDFNSSLQSGWLKSEVLMNYMKVMTGDLTDEQLRSMGLTDEQIVKFQAQAQAALDAATKVRTFSQLTDTMKESIGSGWAQTFEILIGDFEEASELFTSINDVFDGFIQKSANARNEVLQGWKDFGGRNIAIKAVQHAFEGILSVINPVKEAFREIFPPMTAHKLFSLTVGLRNLMEKLKLSETASQNLKSTFKGLFAVLDIVKKAFSAIWNAIRPLLGGLSSLAGSILGVTGSWGEWLVKLNETIKSTDIFNKVVQGIVSFVKLAASAVKDFFKSIGEKINFPSMEIFHSFVDRVRERMAQVSESAGTMKSGVATAIELMGSALANSKFLQVLQALWEGVKAIAGGITKALGDLAGGLVDKLSNADFKGAFDLISGLSIGGIALGINKFLKGLTEPLDGIGGILEGVTGILDSVRGCFEAYQTQLKAGTLLKIASAIGILAASILVISLIDSEKLAASLGAITVLFAELMGSMALFGRISGNLTGVFKTSAAMISISVAVLILASALKKIGDLEFEQMVTGLVGVVGLTATMVAAAKIMGSGSSTMIKGATQMVIFAAAIKILASVCTHLSALSWEELAKGLVGVGVLMAEISLFLNTAKFSGKSITTAAGIVVLAAAIKILVSACKDFGQMEWEEIGKGLAAIGGLLAEVAVFTRLTGNAKHVISSGIALIAIGAAMKIFASAVKDMANMSWEELAKGLVGIAGSLLAVAIAVRIMPKNMIGIGVGLIAVSAALLIVANVLDKLGGMSWEEIAKGLVALGGAMAILAIGLNVMNGTLAGSAALLVAAAALAILAPILRMMGGMSWEDLAKGLVFLAGAFAIIGVAGLLLTPLVPTILALGVAFALIGIGVAAIGVGLIAAGAGLSAVAVGFTALAVAGSAGATAIVAALTVIITGIVSLIPLIAEKLGEGLIAFCKVIADGAPALGEAIKAMVLTLVDVLVECVPAIVKGLFELLTSVLAALVEYTPQIVDSIFQFLIGVLEGVAKNLPALIRAAIDVLVAFFAGIVDALSGIDGDVLLKAIVGVGLLAAIMVALSAVAALVPGALVGVLGLGVVIAALALVLAAIGALAQIPGLSWLINEGAALMQGIGNAIGSFIGGIVGGFMSGVSSSFPKIGSDLSAFMTNIQPFIDGAKNIDASAMDGVKALAETILLLTAANILEGLTSWFTGGSSLTKFGQELATFGPHFKSYYDSIKDVDGTVVESSANAAKALAAFAKEIPNTGGLVGLFTGENSLTKFAEELVVFGPSLKSYADSVNGLDANVVTNSANAASALAAFAKEIPNTGGLIGLFTGENSLSTFAEELGIFGPKLKAYADSVTGLDANVVTNSTNAASALSEFAKNIPNSGGLVGLFTGENSLSSFADDLMVFGPKLKTYADSISGLDASVVTNSTNAAKALTSFAKEIPNSGGLVSLFTGDNSLSTFADELGVFGPKLKAYADSVTGLDANVVTNSANAVAVLTEFAKEIPNSGGILSWFTGDNDIAAFGTKLVSFGQSFAAYYTSVSGIGTDHLAGVVTAFKSLIDLAVQVNSVDTSSLTTFGKNLSTFGKSFSTYYDSVSEIDTTQLSGIVTEFQSLVDLAAAIQNVDTTDMSSITTELTTSVTTMIESVITAIDGKQGSFTSAGNALMVQFVAGINTQNANAIIAITTVLNGCLLAVVGRYFQFISTGMALMTNFIAGIKLKDAALSNSFTLILSGALTAIRNKYTDFYNAGKYLVEGFAAGISDNTFLAEAKAKAMAKAAADAAKRELDERSPSRVGYQIGDYFGVAFVNAIDDYATRAYKAGTNMAQAAKKGLSNAVSKITDFVSGNIDSQPTIRPVLDLADVESGTSKLNALFSRNRAMSISTGMRPASREEIQNGDAPSGPGGTFTFTQNNYSPKALSRIEIYRQTRNQLSTMKGLVRA